MYSMTTGCTRTMCQDMNIQFPDAFLPELLPCYICVVAVMLRARIEFYCCLLYSAGVSYSAGAAGGCTDDSSSQPASGSVRSRSFSDDDAAPSHTMSNDATTSSGEYDRLCASGISSSDQQSSAAAAEHGSSAVLPRRPAGTESSVRYK